MSEKFTIAVWNADGTPKTGASVALLGSGTYSGTELGTSGRYYWASIPLGKYFLRVNGVDTGESFAVGDGEELKTSGGDVFGSVQVETALKVYYDVLNPFSGNGAIDTFAGEDSASVYLTADSLSFDKRVEIYTSDGVSSFNVRNGMNNEFRNYVSSGLVESVISRLSGDSRFQAILTDDLGDPYARLFLGVTGAHIQVTAKGNDVELSHYDGTNTDILNLPTVTGETKTLAHLESPSFSGTVGIDGTNDTLLQIGAGTTSGQSTVVIGLTKTDSDSSHGYVDKSVWNPAVGTTNGHASFDSKATATGASAKDHMVSFQARLNQDAGAGALTYLWGMKHEDTINGAVINHVGFSRKSPLGTGAITNEYGFVCENLIRGTGERIQLLLQGTGATNALKSEGINLFSKSGNALSSAVQLRSSRPSVLMEETDSALDQKFWDFTINGGLLVLRTMQDDMGNAKTWLQFNRSGNDISSLNVNTEIITSASTTTRAGVNLPHGTAPTSPVNGDKWTTTAGEFTRVNGVTEQVTFSAYGEIHVHDSATAQSIPTGATYTLITNWTDNGVSLNTTPDALTNRRITVSKAGAYEVSYNCSMLAGSTNVTFFVSAFKNGTTELDNLHFSRKIGTGTDVGSASFNGIVQLNANDYIDVRIKHDLGGSVNFTQVYANLNLKRV